MLTSIYDLIGRELRAPVGPARLEDAHFDPDTGEIRYFEVALGNWLNSDRALVSAARLSTPTHQDGLFTLEMTEREAREAPVWEGTRLLDRLNIETWPPMILGPFGNGTSPLLAYAGLRVNAGGLPPDAKAKDPDALIAPLERAKDWRGLAVFGWDGEIGPLEDLLFEPATRSIRKLGVRVDGVRRFLDFELLRYRSAGGSQLTVDACARDMPKATA